MLLLSIVQIGAAIIMLPVIIWIWTDKDVTTALLLTLFLGVVSILDNILKPLVMGHGLTTPILVDFWAAWCGPCKTLTPILEKVVAGYDGKVKLAKVDTDAQMQLAAVFGISDVHAIFDGAACFAVQPSDTSTALSALGASVVIEGASGQRIVSIDDFYIGPDVDYLRETVLEQDDVITEVRIPASSLGKPSVFIKAAPRKTIDFARGSIAALVVGNPVGTARITLGAVAPTPHRAKDVETFLIGKRLDDEIAKVVGGIESAYLAAKRREDDLRAQLDAQNRGLERIQPAVHPNQFVFVFGAPAVGVQHSHPVGKRAVAGDHP